MLPIEKEIARQRAHLLTVEQEQTATILRAYQPLAARLNENLQALARQIETAQRAGTEIRPGWLISQARYRQLIADLREHTDTFIAKSTVAVTNGQRAAVQAAFDDGLRLAKLALGPAPESVVARLTTGWDRLPTAALDHLIGRASNTGPLGHLLNEITPLGPDRVRDTLNFGVAAGKNPRVIAREVQQSALITRHRALVISRTEIVGAHREAKKQTWAQTGVVQKWTWVSAKDRRTCAACWAQDGTEHPAGEPMGSHPQCFPAGTVVSGPEPTAATARHYDGEIVVVRFASGDELTVTPNHPVLTTDGWVFAGKLHEGSDVVRRARQERHVPAVDPDDDESPLLIEDVAEALRSAGSVTTARVPAAAEHFHGDGLGGEIDVVRADGPLRDGHYPAIGEPLGEDPFCLRVVPGALLAGLGHSDSVFEGLWDAPDGFVSGLYVPAVVLDAPCSHHQAVSVAPATEDNTGLDEAQADRVSGDAERAGDGLLALAGLVARDDLGDRETCAHGSRDLRGLEGAAVGSGAPEPAVTQDGAQSPLTDPVPSGADLDRFAGEVVADRVVEVLVRRFVGQVFNLETVDGWYIANDTIVHNCRCTNVPVTPSWEELGFTGVPDTRPVLPTGPDTFERLTEADKLGILGRAKLDAYNAGDITLSDLVKHTHSDRWGPGSRVASLEEALA